VSSTKTNLESGTPTPDSVWSRFRGKY